MCMFRLEYTNKSMQSFPLINKWEIGKEPLIKHFMKGTFNLKPSLPRYGNTWNAQTVIQYLDCLDAKCFCCVLI